MNTQNSNENNVFFQDYVPQNAEELPSQFTEIAKDNQSPAADETDSLLKPFVEIWYFNEYYSSVSTELMSDFNEFKGYAIDTLNGYCLQKTAEKFEEFNINLPSYDEKGRTTFLNNEQIRFDKLVADFHKKIKFKCAQYAGPKLDENMQTMNLLERKVYDDFDELVSTSEMCDEHLINYNDPFWIV